MSKKPVYPKVMSFKDWLRFRIDWMMSATRDELTRVEDLKLTEREKMVYDAGVRRGYVIASDILRVHNFILVDHEDM
jgi:hypothetical protein